MVHAAYLVGAGGRVYLHTDLSTSMSILSFSSITPLRFHQSRSFWHSFFGLTFSFFIHPPPQLVLFYSGELGPPPRFTLTREPSPCFFQKTSCVSSPWRRDQGRLNFIHTNCRIFTPFFSGSDTLSLPVFFSQFDDPPPDARQGLEVRGQYPALRGPTLFFPPGSFFTYHSPHLNSFHLQTPPQSSSM